MSIKYNVTYIMKRAWEIKKEADRKTRNKISGRERVFRELKQEEKTVFSECLKLAWKEAKRALELKTDLEVSKENAELIAETEGNLKLEGHTGIRWTIWEGYGHIRAYYKCADMSKYWNNKKDNFIELERVV